MPKRRRYCDKHTPPTTKPKNNKRSSSQQDESEATMEGVVHQDADVDSCQGAAQNSPKGRTSGGISEKQFYGNQGRKRTVSEVSSTLLSTPSQSSQDSDHDDIPCQVDEQPTSDQDDDHDNANARPDYTPRMTGKILIGAEILCDLLTKVACTRCLLPNLKCRMREELGFCKNIEVYCEQCRDNYPESTFSFYTTPITKTQTFPCTRTYPVNGQAVNAFLDIGCGYQALKRFCIGLDIHPIAENYYNKHVKALHETSRFLKELTLESAVKIIRNRIFDMLGIPDDGRVLDIIVSFDGSWRYRGFHSKIGMGCVIEYTSGLIIDYAVLCSIARIVLCLVISLEQILPNLTLGTVVTKILASRTILEAQE